MRMVIVGLMGVVVLGLSGCMATYEPVTRRGLECKNVCAREMMHCGGLPVSCEEGKAQCFASCAELERLDKSAN